MNYYYIMATSLKSAMSPLNSISRSFTSSASSTSFNIINTVLANDYWRAFLLTVVSVYAGYTLQPVPMKLNKLFDTSTIFKYVILLILLLTAFYPLDNNKVVLAIIVPIMILVFFEFLRKVDDMEGEDLVGSVTASVKSVANEFNPKKLFGCN